jgi:LmbE family N-acetylglucosaminyl deacetylase
MSELLLRRPLVLVAHQDDEAIGCAILLQRSERPSVIFATDGAPSDPYFWKEYGSQVKLAQVRREEASRAMAVLRISDFRILSFSDQELYRNLPAAIQQVSDIARTADSTCIVTHAYEGGHPDHDSCSYIAAAVGQRLEVPVWEMPLYHRAGGNVVRQSFVAGDAELTLKPTDAEYARKKEMAAQYASQGNVIGAFPAREEKFRRQPVYDYVRPPHAGQLNYEAWHWSVTGAEVSRAFAASNGAES